MEMSDDIHPVKSNNTTYLPQRISRSLGDEETDTDGPYKLGQEDIRNGALEGRQVRQIRPHSSPALGPRLTLIRSTTPGGFWRGMSLV